MKRIVIYSLVVILALFLIEQVLEWPYILKTIAKLILFSIPIKLINLKFKVNNPKVVLLLGVLTFMVVMIAYFIFRGFIDFETINSDLSSRMKITPSMFIGAGLYTIFINAFIEEVFFRGFVYQGLKKSVFGNIYSSMLFATYHVAIFASWFSIPLMALILLGLFIGGLIFNYVLKMTDGIVGPYMVHLAADVAIVWIGVMNLHIAA